MCVSDTWSVREVRMQREKKHHGWGWRPGHQLSAATVQTVKDGIDMV